MANLNISQLDFDQIKQNLKTYLQAQSQFTDYDFEGSGLSVLLDILAYNTHYNSYMANMVVNEMFLDSAVKRESAVSIAKHLGYTPRSARAARALLDITVNNPTSSPSSLTLDAYTEFNTTINGNTYSFVNLEDVTIQPDGGVYLFSDVPVKEGSILTYSYTVEDPGPQEKYEIPNEDVDTSTLVVTVKPSAGSTTKTTYVLDTDSTQLDSNSLVYFLDENAYGKYEIYFGDGVLGKLLTAGNIVEIKYLVTSGSDANTSGKITQTFTYSGSIGGSSDIDITTVENSTNGAIKEDITDIKFNAPKFSSSLNRAVTQTDYESIIKAGYPLAESIAVWGGEDNDPPIYGKVIIALKPYDGYVISTATKESIKSDILSSKKVMAIQPEFVDPEYTYVNLIVDVTYNSNQTSSTSSQIQSLVQTEVENYFSAELQKFDKDFYMSALTSRIQSAVPAIKGVIIEPKVQKRLVPTLNSTNSYAGATSIKFLNKLHPQHVNSTYYYITSGGIQTLVYFKDVPNDNPPNYNGSGTLKLYNVDTGAILNTSFGTVNYATGEISIPTLTVVGYPTGVSDIKITSELQEASYNITALRNQILVLDDSARDATVNRSAGLTINITSVVE